MIRTLQQVSLYSVVPFFCFPHKLALNALSGDSYAVAYTHFREGHSGKLNLALHFVCLTFTVLANAAVLSAIDGWLPPMAFLPAALAGRWLSALTAVGWIATLAASPAPLPCSIASTALIATAMVLGPWVRHNPDALEHYTLPLFVTLMVVGKLLSNASVPKCMRCTSGPLRTIALWSAVLVAWRVAALTAAATYGAALSAQSTTLLRSLAALLVLLSALPNPLKPTVVVGMIACRAVAVASGVPEVQLLGYGFFGSFLQGMAHRVTGEDATLLTLEKSEASSKRLAYEWSHVTFFPNLLFHVIYNACLTAVSTKKA
jgi:hypothetical protein